MMNSPLARHLTRFSSEVPVAMFAPEPELELELREPLVTLSVADLEAQVEAARVHARAEALATAEQQIAALKAEHDGAVDGALAAARAAWVSEQTAAFGASCEAAWAALRELMCARLADVVRPLLAEIVIKRAVSDLAEMMERLLADPSRPLIKVRGPADLIKALQAARSEASSLELEACDAVEVTMTADGSHVETQIAAALSALFTEALS